MKIHKCFDGIVGQHNAKALLSQSLESAERGGYTASPLIKGTAGLGKTEIATAYARGLEGSGRMLKHFTSPEEFRARGEDFQNLLQLLMDHATPWCLFIDEAQGLVVNQPTRPLQIMRAFIMKALDAQNHNKVIQITDDFQTIFDPTKHTIILSTNFPHMLDKSGALQSRCINVELELYSKEQLQAIAKGMLWKDEFECENEEVLKIIAHCGRGTARPIHNIIRQLIISKDGRHKAVTFDEAMDTLKILEMYPKGFNKSEIHLLVECSKQALRIRQFQAIAPNMELSELQNSVAYLSINGMLNMLPSGMVTTPKGKAYLTRMDKLGFSVPKAKIGNA